MTMEEREILQKLLASEPEEETNIPEEAESDAIDIMLDIEEEQELIEEALHQEPPLDEAPPENYFHRMDQLNQECNHLFHVNRELRSRVEALEEDLRQKERDAELRQTEKEEAVQEKKYRAVLAGFVTGVALAWVTAFFFGYVTMLGGKLFNLLANLLDTAPALLSGAVVTMLLGVMLLVKSKAIIDWLMSPPEEEY